MQIPLTIRTLSHRIAEQPNRSFWGNNMMKRMMLWSVMAAVCLLMLAGDASAQKLGGYKAADAAAADVQAAAEFAVATRAEKEQKEMELVDVLVAEKQVVAGTNYRLCLKVDSEAGEGQDYVTIFVQAVVYVDLKGNKKLSSWAISDCGGEDDG